MTRYSNDEQYDIWIERNILQSYEISKIQREIEGFRYKPLISIIMPVYNTKKEWLQLAIKSVLSQIYPHWELCICDNGSTLPETNMVLKDFKKKDSRIKITYLKPNGGIAAGSNEALKMASGDFIGFVDSDDEITADALYEVAKLVIKDPEIDMVYSDQDRMYESRIRHEPFFKPDWSPETLLSMNYITHFRVIRKTILDKMGGLIEENSQDGSAADYDLVLHAGELARKVGHIPKILYSWKEAPSSSATLGSVKPRDYLQAMKYIKAALRRRGVDGDVVGDGGLYRILFHFSNEPLVSIIITACNDLEILKCLYSIKTKTSYQNYEIIVVATNDISDHVISYLQFNNCKVIQFNYPLNYSKMYNLSFSQVNGEYVIFLHGDTMVLEEDWIGNMLGWCQMDKVGAVGCKLLYPNNTVQHAGIVVGIGGTATRVFVGWSPLNAGPLQMMRVARNCSAVSSCMMIKKSVLNEIGAFNENYAVSYYDYDYCLRLLNKGYRNVYTPFAILSHNESIYNDPNSQDDEDLFKNNWSDFIMKGDPYYNINLSREIPFKMEI